MLDVRTGPAVDLWCRGVGSREIAGHVSCSKSLLEPFSSGGADSSGMGWGFGALDSDVVLFDGQCRYCVGERSTSWPADKDMYAYL